MRVRLGQLSALEKREIALLEQRAREAFAAVERQGPGEGLPLLSSLHPNLGAERAADGTLIVRARAPEFVPLAERVVSLAPVGLGVSSHRPALSLASALALVPRGGAADFSSVRVRAGFTRGHLLELVLSLPGGAGSDEERALSERLVWDIAGERRADHWIGAVEVAPAPRNGPLKVLSVAASEQGFPLAELGASLDAAIAGLTATLPESPLWEQGGGDWTMFEVEPEALADYSEKDDLVLAITRVPELLRCYLEGSPFASLRFSRHGELFFHLKYESEGNPDERLSRRNALEQRLDSELIAARAGRVVGGGLGLRYSYLDFAFSELELGLRLVAERARAEKLPQRSWLQPFDSELAGEWLEIWSGAEAPPRRQRAA